MSDPLLDPIKDNTPETEVTEIHVPEDKQPQNLGQCHQGDVVTVQVTITGGLRDPGWRLIRTEGEGGPIYLPAETPCTFLSRRNPRK